MLALLCTAASQAAILHVKATHVSFFYDRFLVEADGGVRIETPQFAATGDAFSMDLKLNRFVLAGHVRLESPSGIEEGAALSDFLDFDRLYFLPVAEGADRWTFLNGDLAHPVKGRDMPGDAFALPDPIDTPPYLETNAAVIGARSFIRFGPSRVNMAAPSGSGYVTLPSYYINFSSDQHLGQNSLAGATFDATYAFAGNGQSISALHARYDTIDKTYLAFEQHLSGKHAYAVFSVNPVTRPSKFWNLLLSGTPSPNFQIRSFTQLHTFGSGLSEPSESSLFTTVQATQGFSGSFARLTAQFSNFSLLPVASDPSHPVIPNHPFQLELTAQPFDRRIGLSPLYEQIQYGFGYVHDAYGLQTLGGTPYTTIWNHELGLQLYVPSFKLTTGPRFYDSTFLTASVQKQRTWYSTPHYVDVASSSLGLSRAFSAHLNAFANYSVQNTADVYAHGLGSQVYVPFVPLAGGVPYPGYAAFNGTATFRTLALGAAYSNNGFFSASLLARKHDDFPKSVPDIFPDPPLDVLGRELLTGNYLGQPPYDITAAFRARIDPHLSIDVERSYYFHFGHRGWSPEFVIQLGP